MLPNRRQPPAETSEKVTEKALIKAGADVIIGYGTFALLTALSTNAPDNIATTALKDSPAEISAGVATGAFVFGATLGAAKSIKNRRSCNHIAANALKKGL